MSREQLAEIGKLVEESFETKVIDALPGSGDDALPHLEELLEDVAGTRVAVGLLEAGGEKASLISMREQPGDSASPLERCATWALENKVLEPALGTQAEAVDKGLLYYSHDSEEVSRLIRSGDFQLGFVLPPMSLSVFEDVVLSGERMPIKSTYFSPKLPTGLVINRLV